MTDAIAETEAFYNSPSQPCHKVKRVAEALTEPVASEERDAKDRPWCWLPGEVCLKEKREAEPVTRRKKHQWCWLPGSACVKAKRQLQELEAAFMKL